MLSLNLFAAATGVGPTFKESIDAMRECRSPGGSSCLAAAAVHALRIGQGAWVGRPGPDGQAKTKTQLIIRRTIRLPGPGHRSGKRKVC